MILQRLSPAKHFLAYTTRCFSTQTLKASVADNIKVSPKKADFSKTHTVVAENGAIISFHPDQPFPYEHSKPIPIEVEPFANSPIREALHENLNIDKFVPKHRLSVNDLRNMFYADKLTFRIKYRSNRIQSTVHKPLPPRRGL